MSFFNYDQKDRFCGHNHTEEINELGLYLCQQDLSVMPHDSRTAADYSGLSYIIVIRDGQTMVEVYCAQKRLGHMNAHHLQLYRQRKAEERANDKYHGDKNAFLRDFHI